MQCCQMSTKVVVGRAEKILSTPIAEMCHCMMGDQVEKLLTVQKNLKGAGRLRGFCDDVLTV